MLADPVVADPASVFLDTVAFPLVADKLTLLVSLVVFLTVESELVFCAPDSNRAFSSTGCIRKSPLTSPMILVVKLATFWLLWSVMIELTLFRIIAVADALPEVASPALVLLVTLVSPLAAFELRALAIDDTA